MRRFLLRALVLLAVLASAASSYAQTITTRRDNFGTEFYLAFGPNEGWTENPPVHNVMDLYITSRVATRGTVEVPALNYFRTFTTTPGVITTIQLPDGNGDKPTVELDMDQAEQVIHGMAVHITSDSAIAVFGMNHKKYSTDAFMALPTPVLGTEYLTMNYQTSLPYYDMTTPSQFWLVAVEDSTNVTITLNDMTSRGTPKRNDINVRLDKGDVYLVQGSPTTEFNDLTGTLIEADHPIAVFSGHRRTEMPVGAENTNHQPSRDHLVEQLPPVSAWGDSALVVPYATSALPDLVRVLCAEDGTRIDTNGVDAGTYKAGEFLEIPALSGVTNIQATKPILVGQFMHTSYGSIEPNSQPYAYGDPALALVFPVEQFDTAYTVVSVEDPAFTGNYMNIVAEWASVNTMVMDGKPMDPKEFTRIGASRYAYAQHRFDKQGSHTIYGAKPFGVTIYGLGPVDSYSYTGGTMLKTITPLQTVSLVIDFGDRVLKPDLSGWFDTVAFLDNISDDHINIFDFPRRIQDTGKFRVTDPTVSTATPYTLQPHGSGSFTIRFEPKELNRRMHTQVTAKTDHLRAYVVDVYGRGVKDNFGTFRDPKKTIPIDTLDFGLFDPIDPPGDSAIYIGNAGLAAMNVAAWKISGTDAADFSEIGTTYTGVTESGAFTILPAPSEAARMKLRFTPQPNMGTSRREALLTVTTTSGDHLIYLVAHTLKILPAEVPTEPYTFEKLLVCSEAVFDVKVKNPNPVDVTVTDAEIIGPNAADFAITTRTPLVLAPNSESTIQVHFIPIDKGVKNAKVLLTFDLPKHASDGGPSVPDTIPISGTADKRLMAFAGATHVHAYANDDFIVPILATTDLSEYKADGYRMLVTYDSVWLKLIEVVTGGTLTPPGYISIYGSNPPGSDTIFFSEGGESNKNIVPIVGGGGASAPFVYLRFRPVLHGVPPDSFQRAFDIHYDVLLNNSVVPAQCYDRVFDSGYVQIIGLCDTLWLQPKGQLPMAMALEQPVPNPAATTATFEYDIASDEAVTIRLCDARGNTIRTIVDEAKRPGYYTGSIPAAELPSGAYLLDMKAGSYHRARRVVIQK